MKEKNYKLLKKLILVLIITVAVATVLTACNGDNGQTSEPSDQKPPIEQSQTTVSKIMADMSAYKNFDLLSEFNNVALDIVDKKVQGEAELLIYTVESHNFVVIAQNENGSFTSVAVPLSQTCENYIKNSSSKESLILAVANLTGSTQIEASGKGTVQQKISTAIQTIVDNVAAIENGETAQLNTYVSDGDKIDLSEVYGNNRSAAYLREDGSVIAFVFDEEKCEITMKHYVVDGAKGMTTAQIVSAIKNGAATTNSTNLKFNEDYTIPPLDQQAETITGLEIMQGVFANFTPYNFETKAQEIVNAVFNRSNPHKILFYSATDNGIVIFSEDTTAKTSLCKTEYNGEVGQKLKKLLSNNSLEEIAKTYGIGLTTSYEKNSDEYQNKLQTIKDIFDELSGLKSSVESLQSSSFGAARIATSTNDISNYTDYAQKLFPGKEIVAAYVGDMGYRNIDSQGRFNTGYFCTFDIAVAYKDGDDIKVNEVNCMVPWYTNSTNETLYNSLLNGTEGQTYKLQNSQTTVVSNPIIVNSKET